MWQEKLMVEEWKNSIVAGWQVIPIQEMVSKLQERHFMFLDLFLDCVNPDSSI
jgi:hypothetical protein